MRQRRRTLGAALVLGTAGVLMAAGPVQAEESGGSGQTPGLPQVPGVPTEVPSGIPSDIPTELPGGGAPKVPGAPSVPGLPGAAGGGDSGGDSGGGAAAGGGSGDSGGDAGGSTGGGGGSSTTGKEIKVPYKCKTPIGDKEATSGVKIDAAESGGSYELTVKFSESVMDSPAEIPKDSLKPSMDVKVGGDDKGTVKVDGPGNKEPVKQGDPVEIPDLKGTYKPGAEGKATLSPGVLTVKALGTTTTCTPAEEPKPSLELDTSDQGGVGGGSSGGSAGSSGGDAAAGGAAAAGGTGGEAQAVGGSSGGGLAETGAADNGGIEALGLVAGTVILLGGAVFTFTPWRKLRSVR